MQGVRIDYIIESILAPWSVKKRVGVVISWIDKLSGEAIANKMTSMFKEL